MVIEVGLHEHQTLKKYGAPRLEMLGDVRTLTLGGSPGTGESAVGGSKKPKVQRYLDPANPWLPTE